MRSAPVPKSGVTAVVPSSMSEPSEPPVEQPSLAHVVGTNSEQVPPSGAVHRSRTLIESSSFRTR